MNTKMKCTVKDLPPIDQNLSPAELRGEWDRIAKQNLENIESLMASKGFISHCHNSISTQGTRVGMPVNWGDKLFHHVPLLPHGDNDAFEIGSSSAGLE